MSQEKDYNTSKKGLPDIIVLDSLILNYSIGARSYAKNHASFLRLHFDFVHVKTKAIGICPAFRKPALRFKTSLDETPSVSSY